MNRIVNATGLDGATGWNTSAGAVLVDDSEMGAPNRLVLRSAEGVFLYYYLPIIPGATRVFGATDHPAAATLAGLEWAGGASNGVQVPFARKRSGAAVPIRGIASTFARSAGEAAIPAGATHVLLIVQGAAGVPAMFRPILAFDGPQCWRPGPHLNPDLAIPAFPSIEPQREGFELEPIALRKGFAGDAGVPITRRVAATSRRFASVEYALDAIGRDLLDQFWRANHDEFWFVRPDNGDLCVAEWADDGDPKDSGAGSGRRTSVRLLLRDS